MKWELSHLLRVVVTGDLRMRKKSEIAGVESRSVGLPEKQTMASLQKKPCWAMCMMGQQRR